MDRIPKPDQVVAAASNVAQKVLYGGLADLRPMPRTLIDEGELREVYHYRPSASAQVQGDPVLLVTPLAAPSICYDLRRGCSVVEHLVTSGRPTYLVEYGEVSFKNRNLGMEHWIEEVVPTAIREVSAHAGGRPVHVVGWSLGGIFSLLATADGADLPIASLTVVGSPFDVSLVPLVAPLRPLLNLGLTLGGGRGAITRSYQMMGGAPKPLVKWAFQLSSFQKLVTKPIALATHLDDADFLAQIAPLAASIHCVTIPDQPASLSAERLAAEAGKLHAGARPAASVAGALQAIDSGSGEAGRPVMICGSLYLAGHVLAANGTLPD